MRIGTLCPVTHNSELMFTLIGVHILATVPECQGRGAASALLRHISHMADTEGRPLYLEAAPGSLPVYLKHGFREVGETLRLPAGTTSVTDSVVTAMVREPVSA